MAARLFSLIERKLGITAPLAMLFEAATPRKLAARLWAPDQDRWKALVPIRSTGTRPPLFVVHGAEGNVLLYRALAARLGEDQPVYGLQSYGLDGKAPAETDFERLAARYIEEIRQVQAHGPYMLGGYCLGGTIALEMARQLMEAGETVGLMAMIEHFNVCTIQWPLPWRQRSLNRFILNPYYHLRNLVDAKRGKKWQFFVDKLRVELRRGRATADLAKARLRRRWNQNEAGGYHHISVAAEYDKAFARFVPKPYPGEITLLLTERRLAGMTEPLGGWTAVAPGRVRLISLPFSPKGSLVEPYVEQLAGILRGCIDEAMLRSQPPVEVEVTAHPASCA